MYNSRTHLIASNINFLTSYLWFCIHLSHSDISKYQAKTRKTERKKNKLTLPDQVGIGSVLRQAHSSVKKKKTTYKVLLKSHIRKRHLITVNTRNVSNKKKDNKLTSNRVYKYHLAGRGVVIFCWREGVVCFVRAGSVFQFLSAFLSDIYT